MKGFLLLFLFSFVFFSANCQDNLESETIEFQESLGILRLGERINIISSNLGKPDQKSKVQFWEGDGQNHQTWIYSKKGIVLDVVVEKKSKLSWVNMITIQYPCDLKTEKNVGIGSSNSEILKQYKDVINTEESNDDQIVLGSIYGGIIFQLKDGLVESIFFGAAAE